MPGRGLRERPFSWQSYCTLDIIAVTTRWLQRDVRYCALHTGTLIEADAD